MTTESGNNVEGTQTLPTNPQGADGGQTATPQQNSGQNTPSGTQNSPTPPAQGGDGVQGGDGGAQGAQTVAPTNLSFGDLAKLVPSLGGTTPPANQVDTFGQQNLGVFEKAAIISQRLGEDNARQYVRLQNIDLSKLDDAAAISLGMEIQYPSLTKAQIDEYIANNFSDPVTKAIKAKEGREAVSNLTRQYESAFSVNGQQQAQQGASDAANVWADVLSKSNFAVDFATQYDVEGQTVDFQFRYTPDEGDGFDSILKDAAKLVAQRDGGFTEANYKEAQELVRGMYVAENFEKIMKAAVTDAYNRGRIAASRSQAGPPVSPPAAGNRQGQPERPSLIG